MGGDLILEKKAPIDLKKYWETFRDKHCMLTNLVLQGKIIKSAMNFNVNHLKISNSFLLNWKQIVLIKMATIKSDDPVIVPSISGRNIKAVFTTKRGDPKKEGILKNFVYQNSDKPDLILKRLQSGYPLRQVHSNSVYKFHSWFIGRQGDGMFTNKKFLPCVINVDDCVPILIKNKSGTEVLSLIHI